MGAIYKFPKFYDWTGQLFFEGTEHSPLSSLSTKVMEIQSLQKNAIVLDLACGTGIIGLWIAENRPDVYVVGVDLAEDMLADAEQVAKEKKLQNISFVCQSVLNMTKDDLISIGRELSRQNIQTEMLVEVPAEMPVEMVVCSYGFSAMSNYQELFEHSVNLLDANGRYVIMDINYPKRTLLSLFMTYCVDNWLWGSNQLKRVWEVMPKQLTNFEKYEKSFKLYHFVPAVFFVAKGVK